MNANNYICIKLNNMTSAPEFLDYILSKVRTRINEFSFIDNDNSISKYLEHLYEYEINRFPKHRSFERNYRLNYFDKEKMLTYYLDPFGESNLFVSFRVNGNGDKEFFISKTFYSRFGHDNNKNQ